MVYFEGNLVKFPKHFPVEFSKITLIHGLTREVIELEVEDKTIDDTYYLLDFTGVHLDNGTYTYVFGKECGLLQVGDYKVEKTTYENKKDKIIYER